MMWEIPTTPYFANDEDPFVLDFHLQFLLIIRAREDQERAADLHREYERMRDEGDFTAAARKADWSAHCAMDARRGVNALKRLMAESLQ